MFLQRQGLELVSRLNKAKRRTDFRKGIRLGKEDHIVYWKRPATIKSVNRQEYKSLPDFLVVREVRFHVDQPGFRSRSIVVVTTLLDPRLTSKDDLAELYRARWNNELDLRSIKSTMQMDFLRCKTPSSIRKEVWTHILAYNLIRTIMAQAASQHGIHPRTISFKGAMQTLEAFQQLIELQGSRGEKFRNAVYLQLLTAIAAHRVANRPDRIEPRFRKRRHKWNQILTKTRSEAKLDLLKRVKQI